jgi:predicted RNA-binding protein with PIN domain
MTDWRYLLIDGHSVLFNLPSFNTLHQKQPRKARELLASRSHLLHQSSNWRVTLIFDGKESSAQPAKNPSEALILYANELASADSVIEQIIGNQPVSIRQKIFVVTNDEEERRTVEAMGALCYSCEWLEQEFQLHAEQTQATLRKLKRGHDDFNTIGSIPS